MSEKWENVLDSEVFRHIVAGLGFASCLVFAILAVAAFIAGLAVSLWWLVAFVLSGLLSGVSLGVGIYCMDSCF